LLLRPPTSSFFPYTTLFRSGGQSLLKRSQLVGNFTLNYEVVPDLALTATYGMNGTDSRSRVYTKLMTFWDQYNPDQIASTTDWRSEEHTSELQSRENLVCRL